MRFLFNCLRMLGAALLVGASAVSQAQTWPERPVRLVVPFSLALRLHQGFHTDCASGRRRERRQHVKSSRLRALAVTGDKRSALAHELPAVAEAVFQVSLQ